MFSDPEKLLTGANEDFEVLARDIGAFIAKNPYARAVDLDPETGMNITKLRLTEPIPEIFNRTAMHIIDDLRSTLDQIGFTCARAFGNRRLKDTYFPFADSAAQIDNVIARRCKDLPAEIKALFRSYKPYKGGNDLLWSLNNMANSKKHRVLVPAARHLGGSAFGLLFGLGGMSSPFKTFDSAGWDAEKNEVKLYASHPGSIVTDFGEVSLCIAFGDEVEVVARKPVLDVLDALGRTVGDILRGTKAEAIRIGLIA